MFDSYIKKEITTLEKKLLITGIIRVIPTVVIILISAIYLLLVKLNWL